MRWCSAHPQRRRPQPRCADRADKFPPRWCTTRSTTPVERYQFVANGTALTGPTVDTSVANQVKFTFGGYIAPGESAYIDIVLKVAPGTPSGTQIKNQYGITWDVTVNGKIHCTAGSTAGATPDFDGQGTDYCTDDENVTVKQSRGLSSLKEVRVTLAPRRPTLSRVSGVPTPVATPTTRAWLLRRQSVRPSPERHQRRQRADEPGAADRRSVRGDSGVIVGSARLSQ